MLDAQESLEILREADAIGKLRDRGYQVTEFQALVPPTEPPISEAPVGGVCMQQILQDPQSVILVSFFPSFTGSAIFSPAVIAAIVVGGVVVAIAMALLVIATILKCTKPKRK